MAKTNLTLGRLLPAAAVIALLVPAAASADAGPANAGPHRVPIGNQPFDLGPEYCGYPLHVDVVKDKQYVVNEKANSDGSVTTIITGQLVLRFTNLNTRKSLTTNASGPTFITSFASGRFAL